MYLQLDCITVTHALHLQINLSLICRLGVLKMWERRLWYHPAMPRPGWYENVTATYIRRENMYIYIHTRALSISICKNQSTEVCDNIHSNKKKYKYTVITECDPILHEYYIAKGVKLWFIIYEQYKRCSRATKKSHELDKGEQVWKDLLLVCLLLEISMVHSRGVSSEIWTCGSRIVIKQSSEYVKWSQVACTGKHMCTEKHAMYISHASIE